MGYSSQVELHIKEWIRYRICWEDKNSKNDLSVMHIQITVDNEEDQKLKKIMKKAVRELVRSQLAKYISGLKEEFSKGMILPKKGETKPDQVNNLTSDLNKKVIIEGIKDLEDPPKLRIAKEPLKIKETFLCKAQEFYVRSIRTTVF